MRVRTGIIKKLLLSGATAFSIVGFAAPAAFAMDSGGSYNNSDGYSSNMNYNNNNNYGGGNSCDRMKDGNYNGWDGNYMNRYCMSSMHYSNYNNQNRCDRNKYPTLY
jgi:hypothetical protein